MLNFYPPYIGAGVHVDYIAPDYREVRVSMGLRFYNRNYFGTHFGGSLYTMTDPFFTLMLVQILGRGYVVWDRHAAIDFVRPGRGRVTAVFTLNDAQIDDIIAKTAGGERYLPEYVVDVCDEQSELVARVFKTLYVRRKPPKTYP